mmetsp:Transcript_2313/g.5375  ORF Transcript_2313/g.5375 Transcript_2313/m.5375 type:complete len:130 (-) Transcript_2313:306-695(-)
MGTVSRGGQVACSQHNQLLPAYSLLHGPKERWDESRGCSTSCNVESTQGTSTVEHPTQSEKLPWEMIHAYAKTTDPGAPPQESIANRQGNFGENTMRETQVALSQQYHPRPVDAWMHGKVVPVRMPKSK